MFKRWFRTRYRIVSDEWSGYEAQYRYWWMPYYWMVNGCNTSRTLERAEQIIDKHRNLNHVIKQIS